MADNNSTILIPDISGFTEFMTNTELSHGTHAINILIDAIINAVGDEYEVSEIEGDAVLLIKKEASPSKKDIMDTCFKIFNSFHFQRKWLQQYAICACSACQSISDLTLKFVVHHGPLAEMKIGRFVKQSGAEMIVAHRLLKNSIDNNEYLLMTEKLLDQAVHSPEESKMEWFSSSEEYASIGKINYQFTLLNEARKNVPEPPAPQNYHTDDTAYLETEIAAGFRDVYMAIMNIPERPTWLQGLQKVEQNTPYVFVGSIHHCTFDDFQATISPLRMTLSTDEIIYAESCQIIELNLSLVHEFVFKKTGEDTSSFASRFMNAGDTDISPEVSAALTEKMMQMAERLKEYCEKNKAA